jgi:signal transduction histidine kinase
MRAERRGDVLRVEVADNGRGLTIAEGHGMGLTNIRSRLSTLYGDRANLTLQPGEPRGLVASVSLPLSTDR